MMSFESVFTLFIENFVKYAEMLHPYLIRQIRKTIRFINIVNDIIDQNNEFFYLGTHCSFNFLLIYPLCLRCLFFSHSHSGAGSLSEFTRFEKLYKNRWNNQLIIMLIENSFCPTVSCTAIKTTGKIENR